MQDSFIPVCRCDMEKRGWEFLDILFISADAYVDHSSFAAALLCRLLESKGFRVGLIAQPDWHSTADIERMGRPKLCCMISGGNIDSMVAHYTSSGKKRSDDRYSPGGKAGFRPDRPTIVYSGLVKQAFKGLPVVIGGLEASLRRFSHYDFWQNIVRKPIILDSKADLLVYGMGELQTLEIAQRLKDGEKICDIHDIAGTCWSISEKDYEKLCLSDICTLPSFEEVSRRDVVSNTPTKEGKRAFAESFSLQMKYRNPFESMRLLQKCDARYVVQNPPIRPLTTAEMDMIYGLPFTRTAHPSYEKYGGVPALAEVQFSITSTRGCFGSCSFCAISAHQGRIIQTRSIQSLVKEAQQMTFHPDFKGYIHDLGGPSANFQAPSCKKQLEKGPCQNRECLFPHPCPNIEDSHAQYLEKLKAVASVPGVKKVFIRSGIRYDYLMLCCNEKTRFEFLKQLISSHVSGQLKVAPEHISDNVLKYMGKPSADVYTDFCNLYEAENKRQGKKQYIIPYLIAAHPGSTLDDSVSLALFMKKNHFVPDQVQEFYPTPSTVSTCMYYTGLDPRPGMNFEEVYVPRGHEANLQRAMLQFNRPENRSKVLEVLEKTGKQNLAKELLK